MSSHNLLTHLSHEQIVHGYIFFQNHDNIILTTNKIENKHFHLSTYIGHLLAYLTGWQWSSDIKLT